VPFITAFLKDNWKWLLGLLVSAAVGYFVPHKSAEPKVELTKSASEQASAQTAEDTTKTKAPKRVTTDTVATYKCPELGEKKGALVEVKTHKVEDSGPETTEKKAVSTSLKSETESMAAKITPANAYQHFSGGPSVLFRADGHRQLMLQAGYQFTDMIGVNLILIPDLTKPLKSDWAVGPQFRF
jgi:hypothetical protein